MPARKPTRVTSSKVKSVAKAKLETPLTARAKPAPAPRRRKPVDGATVAEVFRRFRAANPEPKGELEHVNPYTLLVAVVLSAQSTDAGVNKATRELFRLADTPQKMLALGEDGVRDHIKTLNFLGLSRRLVEEHGGTVPSSIEVLQTLPGVGGKSASVVANIAFGEPRIAVDTHIFRVANRIPLVATENPLDTQEQLERIVPEEFRLNAHHWLILHGRYVCKARRPECWRCLIRDLCRYEPKTPAP
jgi:endonuclease III